MGFRINHLPEADSPTMLRESLKLFFAVAANQEFSHRSINIWAAFLQAKELDREVYLSPPADLRE